jgi:uncharacterized protein (TIGR00297 family)
MASLLFAFLFPYATWKQAAGCALLLLLFDTLILPWLDFDVSKGTVVGRGTGATASGLSQPPPGLLVNKEGGTWIPAGHAYPAPTANGRTGIILYPISVLALIALYRNHLHIAAAAWAMMALGDGMATVIGLRCGGDLPSGLMAHADADSGCAAPTCGKPLAFQPVPRASSSCALAGRLSLPASAEEIVQGPPPSARRSLSASRAAEPQHLGTLPWNRLRTLPGFISFAVAGTVGAYLLTRWIAPEIPPPKTLMVCAAASLLGAVFESFPIALDDNITVPLVVGAFMFCAYLVERSALDSNLPYLGRRIALAIAVNLAFALLACALKAATRSGAVCGFLLGTAIYLGYGYKSFFLLFAFVLLGSAATRLGFAKKAARGVAEQRGGARSWREALANIVAAAFFAILVITTHHEAAFLIALVAALAEAAGDTVSSEIGQWASDRAYLITTFKLVPAGEDGGISLPGTVAGFAASAIIMGLSLGLGLCGPYRFAGPAIALGAAGVGNLFDSLLGATIQRRGLLTNGMVNFAGTSVAGALALGLALGLGL